MLRELLRAVLGPKWSNLFFNLRDDIIKYRLSPSELNITLHDLASKYDERIAKKNITDFHFVESKGVKFVICPMSKDAETRENEPTLSFFLDTIDRFYKLHTDRDCVLLLPLRMCRHYMKFPPIWEIFKRKHAVLIEIDLRLKTIKVHDSQSARRSSFYPDKITETLSDLNKRTGDKFTYDPKTDYRPYDTQKDPYSCGYFVYKYVREILESGTSKRCDGIRCAIRSEYKNKQEFLSDHGFPDINPSNADKRDLQEFDEESLEQRVSEWYFIEDGEGVIRRDETLSDLQEFNEESLEQRMREWCLIEADKNEADKIEAGKGVIKPDEEQSIPSCSSTMFSSRRDASSSAANKPQPSEEIEIPALVRG